MTPITTCKKPGPRLFSTRRALVLAATLAFVAPPLVFFVLYFCALHSARHLRHGFAVEGNGFIDEHTAKPHHLITRRLG